LSVSLILALIAGFKSCVLDGDRRTVAAVRSASPPSPTRQDTAIALDYSRPIYTQQYAWVCPQSLVLDQLSARGGLRAYEDASLSMFNRRDKFTRLGCQEWQGGIRVYGKRLETSQTDIHLASIRLSPNDIANLFTSEHELKN
jgi:hypothetical protein